jgi:hypothetical protein
MSITLDVSESYIDYKEDLEKGLKELESEISSIDLSLEAISKLKQTEIDKLISDCENNVNNTKPR